MKAFLRKEEGFLFKWPHPALTNGEGSGNKY